MKNERPFDVSCPGLDTNGGGEGGTAVKLDLAEDMLGELWLWDETRRFSSRGLDDALRSFSNASSIEACRSFSPAWPLGGDWLCIFDRGLGLWGAA